MDLWNPQAPLLERVKKRPVLSIEDPGAAILASGFAGAQDALILGSGAQLSDLIQDVETLRNQYILDFGKPTSTEFKTTIDKLVVECEKLLESSSLIEDKKTRQRFFATLKKLATDLVHLTSVKQKVCEIVQKVRDGDHVNRNRTGLVKSLPRWSQFLDQNAPGTKMLLLQLRRLLHPKHNAYQVIPRGGIKILQYWDKHLYSLISTVNTLHPYSTSLWPKRIEWGHPSIHCLNFGIRTFEPIKFKPSPWKKINIPTYIYHDVSYFDQWLSTLIPWLSYHKDMFQPPEYNNGDVFDCVITQRFIKYEYLADKENKGKDKEDKEKDKERHRKVMILG